MSLVVLLRRGGDLASGVALRLRRSGFRVLISELTQPLAVRRLVSFAVAAPFKGVLRGLIHPGLHVKKGLKLENVDPRSDPRVFLFFEEYADQAAIQAHGQHLKELGLDFSAFLDGPVVAEYYEKIAF